jgi:hypothetical protein
MPTSRVNLAAIKPLVEILVRAGDVSVATARQSLQDAYTRRDLLNYPDAVGISTLFREGATLDDLAREGAFPHRKLSFSVIGKIMGELAKARYELVLFSTPTPDLPDHHSLAVAYIGRAGNTEPTLSDAAADALLRALTVVDNPYRRQKLTP